MSEDDVRDLIHSVVGRGSAVGVTTTAAEIRAKFSPTGRTGARRAAAPPLRRRVAVRSWPPSSSPSSSYRFPT